MDGLKKKKQNRTNKPNKEKNQNTQSWMWLCRPFPFQLSSIFLVSQPLHSDSSLMWKQTNKTKNSHFYFQYASLSCFLCMLFTRQIHWDNNMTSPSYVLQSMPVSQSSHERSIFVLDFFGSFWLWSWLSLISWHNRHDLMHKFFSQSMVNSK